MTLKLTGSSKRRAHPALETVISARAGEANIGRTVVALPPSLILDNSHIRTPCTRVQFAADRCPDESRIGSAQASSPLLDSPLRGSVFLRSSDDELPNLVVSLKGTVDIVLVGRIDSTKGGGLRTTFANVPDAPISSFELSLASGKKGLLRNAERPVRFAAAGEGADGGPERPRQE